MPWAWAMLTAGDSGKVGCGNEHLQRTSEDRVVAQLQSIFTENKYATATDFLRCHSNVLALVLPQDSVDAILALASAAAIITVL
eukprot:1463721-Amphidinium_carterae.2